MPSSQHHSLITLRVDRPVDPMATHLDGELDAPIAVDFDQVDFSLILRLDVLPTLLGSDSGLIRVDLGHGHVTPPSYLVCGDMLSQTNNTIHGSNRIIIP